MIYDIYGDAIGWGAYEIFPFGPHQGPAVSFQCAGGVLVKHPLESVESQRGNVLRNHGFVGRCA